MKKYLPAMLMMVGGLLLGFTPSQPTPVDPVNPDVVQPTILAPAALDDYKGLWLELNALGVEKLRAGEFTSEAEYAEWFKKVNIEAMNTAFLPLLKQEKEAFGEGKWTAEKHAAFIEQYNR
jgi:hypothetical protein